MENTLALVICFLFVYSANAHFGQKVYNSMGIINASNRRIDRIVIPAKAGMTHTFSATAHKCLLLSEMCVRYTLFDEVSKYWY
ncbi:MAG: hypothetical protein UX58_C0002G0008 [Candidatus Wolfebacteria bacterium GW2011_GWB2_46_69]|uniref:Uncharacterized protein n=1 Tax=Candidatus Wolfebacteria bacterium GW2011_GWB1_47_1 TaxID=1619007 RepID=A0A0G4ASF2_9BACT|nr:MAG: hypothetical protein UX70_C0001G0783 [Candidatus Wolfebacteria bacterium GW2011_GWB1_47_1]KKU42294.1 MAG: hypothetical protein UX58_C0002G0008 [Candidatus Wolfebacteria bacterium GW2011_GWB2_46_69]KKU53700.1 MAG: hypothetical protein UX76_C0011G0045 [Candidatus Wolfebacteria bacterium GW2011_GWC1_47_103]KKU58945.1 MAG: hypothetical protein UX83_C0010G0067 [Candidatus Wolfebacteria bacterium GW2011_GWE2_47_12]KKU66091.1 MAG: hypothetical protein UX90_C0001G0150 [Candidatus Wolfebacteria 